MKSGKRSTPWGTCFLSTRWRGSRRVSAHRHRFANDRCLWSEHPSGTSRMTPPWYMITLMLKWLPLITETSIPHHVSCGIGGFNAIFPCTPPQCVFATMRSLQKATVCRWIMAQEDDLRALGKIMDFMRGISVLFLLINCYWSCYEAFHTWGLTLSVLNKILMSFQRTAGLFSSILWTKLFCVLFLALSCLGTRGVKEEKMTWAKFGRF